MEKLEIEEFLAKNFGNIELSGFRYLVEACSLYPGQITVIYAKVAQKFNSKASRVERNIRQYISRISDFSCIETRLNETISNSNFIASLCYTINRKKKRIHIEVETYHILSEINQLKYELNQLRAYINDFQKQL